MSDSLTLRSGAVLPITIADYDRGRPKVRRRTLRAACYAPYVSMDFDATGAIRLCNHSHAEIARLGDGQSILDVWRGTEYQRYRDDMRRYVLDDDNCRHCIRQCIAAPPPAPEGGFLRGWLARRRHRNNVFATEQFDHSASDDPAPAFPKRLIFRLGSTCNLACVMCDGQTSSRIRRERDRLPVAPSPYGEAFFRDLETMLPHAEHVEFYGGEPFLVREHLRVFDILERTKARCTIYVNTNAMSFHPRARHYLETLNFRTVAVSMDAVSPDLHGDIRRGLRSEQFHANIDYLLRLRRRRRRLSLMLNVTEHRKNWFELPEVFRFAERHRMYLHINTCIHPHNVTLYTLPTPQLAYVLASLTEERAHLLQDSPRLSNLGRYDFLLALIRSELDSRPPGWTAAADNLNLATDGLLAAPRPGVAPFHRPERVQREIARIAELLDGPTADRLLEEMSERIRRLPDQATWAPALEAARRTR